MRRAWPLLFSALALIGILHLAPTLYEDFKFARDGVAANGWYTDLEEQDKYIHYAYQVGDQTFGGQESWDDENSDIYYHHNGDKLEVSYLAHTPWISRRRWGMQNRWQDSKKWAEIYFAIFMAGIVLALVSRRKQNDLAVKKPSEIGNASQKSLINRKIGEVDLGEANFTGLQAKSDTEAGCITCLDVRRDLFPGRTDGINLQPSCNRRKNFLHTRLGHGI